MKFRFDCRKAIDEKYHPELMELLDILEIDVVDERMRQVQEDVLARIDELKRLSKKG